jgi:predicted Zn-dependent peptidase
VGNGSRFEDVNESGMSHFIEHMLFKGTKNRTAFEISDHIDRIGSNINAFTSKEMTCFYTLSTFEHQEETFEILSDIFLNSTFLPEEIEREKGVVIEEINMTEDAPDEVCLDLLSTAFYQDKGLGMTILGPIENIQKFTQADIFNYMAERYTPDNVVISVAGAVDIDKTVEMVDKYFSALTGKVRDTVQCENQPTYTQSLAKNKDIEQVHIAFSLPAYPYGDKRLNALSIANVVLGGGMSSRLFQKVREELGLCYTVYSYSSAYLGNGKMEIYSAVNPSKVDDAIKAIKAEVEKFYENGITESEFLRGKEQMKSAFILSQESTSSQMKIYGKQFLMMGEVFDFKKKIDEINAITLDEVNAVIKEVFDMSKCAYAIVGKGVNPIK